METEKEGARSRVNQLMTAALARPSAVPAMSSADLDFTLRILRRVRLHGRLAAQLKQEGLLDRLPATAQEQLESALVMAESRSRLAGWELNRIAWALASEPDVPLVLMKGCTYLLLELPNSAGRIFADVDLLLPENDLESIEAVLNRSGWYTDELSPYDQNYYRNWTHELPPLIHVEREVEIDLHHNIVPRTARLKPASAKLLERSRQLPDSRYRVLANEDIVLHAMTHLMFDADLADKLRDLVDIGDLLEYFSGSNNEFWPVFLERAVELDLTRPAYYSLRYVNQLLAIPVPEDALKTTQAWSPPAPIVWFMDRAVPRALFPQHPDCPSSVTSALRFFLYVRSHWIRMPPWLLVYHLSYKFVVTRFGGRQATGEE